MACVNHRDKEATRECTTCLRLWCPLCVRQVKAGTGILEACQKCNGVLRECSKTVKTGAVALHDLLTRPFTVDGLLSAAGLAAAAYVGHLLAYLPGFGAIGTLIGLVYTATLIAYYFQIIDHIGQNRDGLPGPSDAVDDVPHLLSTALRGIVCLLVGTAPLLIWLYKVRDPDVPLTGVSAALHVVGLLMLGMTYMPAVLLAIVLTNSTLGALYPIAWIKIISRAPVSYLGLVLLFIISVIAYWIFTLMAGVLAVVIPIGGVFVVSMVQCLLLFVQACLTGGFLRRNADAFGWD